MKPIEKTNASRLNAADITLALTSALILGTVAYNVVPVFTCTQIDCGMGIVVIWPYLLIGQAIIILDGVVILEKSRGTGVIRSIFKVLGWILVTTPLWCLLIPIALSLLRI
jgi:hypothetical protein